MNLSVKVAIKSEVSQILKLEESIFGYDQNIKRSDDFIPLQAFKSIHIVAHLDSVLMGSGRLNLIRYKGMQVGQGCKLCVKKEFRSHQKMPSLYIAEKMLHSAIASSCQVFVGYPTIFNGENLEKARCYINFRTNRLQSD